MKKYFYLAILILGITACNTDTANNKNEKVTEISLTQDELKTVENNKDAVASLLVKKAISKEMKEVAYTDEEKKALNNSIEDIKMEFYLDYLAKKDVTVDDAEVLKFYQDNEKLFANQDITLVFPKIKEVLYNQKIYDKKVKYLDDLVLKYNLEDTMKKYFPENEETTVAPTNPQTTDVQSSADENNKTTENTTK